MCIYVVFSVIYIFECVLKYAYEQFGKLSVVTMKVQKLNPHYSFPKHVSLIPTPNGYCLKMTQLVKSERKKSSSKELGIKCKCT